MLFSTALNLMKEHSRPCCVLATKIITTKWTDPTKGQHGPQSGRTQLGSNLQVHKVDGPHQGSTRSTKWTDPTRVKPTSPQSGWIQPRVNTVHKVDGPNQGQTYTSPKNGRTQQGSNLYNSKKEDRPYQRSKTQYT